MSSTRFSVGDFVSVERNDRPNQPLKGVIAFMGPVSFAEGSDWVGVRLTGDSVGEGRNDGSVKGKRYFEDCGENGGVFVRKGSISKRQPTRLEELRLRRERKGKGASSGSTGTASGRKSLGGVSRPTGGTSSPNKATSPSKPKSMLQNPSLKAPLSESAAKTPITTTKVVESEGVSRVKKQMEQLRRNRASLGGSSSSNSLVTAEKDKEIKNLKEQNDTLAEQNEDLESQKEALQQELHDLRMQLASPTKLKRESSDNTKVPTTIEPENEEGISSPSSEGSKEMMNSLQAETDHLKVQLQAATTQLTETQSKLTSIEQKSQTQQNQITTLTNELTQTKTQLTTAENELHTISSQNSTHQSSAQSQLKERAKLQAEVASLKRTLKEVEEEKINVESMMEELTLDLEQVKEEKETMEDTLEEKNLEVETQLIDMEDLKIQLEEVGVQLDQARAQLQDHELRVTTKSSEGGEEEGDAGARPSGTTAQSADTEDVVQALSVQNSRLREALLRLREQSSYEKIELSKQLRTAEKEASQLSNLQSNHEKLQADVLQKEKDIKELKEMVDEAHAYEGLMEEMSDKNILLEDTNVALQATIQSLEEASEIAAEMEEVQAEENKTLMADLEERDAKLRNLQEAIKMQRRREDDFQRTVLKYKISIEKLQTEKSALLALHQGDENENSKLIASSQKALAQAAQLVSDAAQMRKKESLTMFDKVERNINAHFAERLQSFVPKYIVHREVLAIKGEMLLSKVAEKASISLQSVSSLFQKSIAKARSDLGTDMMKVARSETEEEEKAVEIPITISESASQEIPTILHELKFAHISIRAGSEALRLLCLGQWPDLLTEDLSAQLGAAVLPPFSNVDNLLTFQLRMFKEEGTLSPHRANLSSFEECTDNLRGPLTAITSLAQDWSPPAWVIFQNVTTAKFSSMCAATIVSCIISPAAEARETFVSNYDSDSSLAELLSKLEGILSESTKICQRLVDLSLNKENENVLKEIGCLAKDWMLSSDIMIDTFQSSFDVAEISTESMKKCEVEVENVSQSVIKLSSLLRSHKLLGKEAGEDGRILYHPLSPEAENTWNGIINLIMKDYEFSGVSVDEEADILEKVNFNSRSSTIYKRLEIALENDSKLALALVQVSTLEKSLASKSKEINMQNSRMVELEKILTQNSYKSPKKPNQNNQGKEKETLSDLGSSEEFSAVKKENKMLMEAMDVLNKQVQEYEDEVRSLKNSSKFKSPQKGMVRSTFGSTFGSPDHSEIGSNIPESFLVTSTSTQSKLISLEAALFRPALYAARVETNAWKAKMIKSSLSQLKPLNVPNEFISSFSSPQPQEGENSVNTNKNINSSTQLEKEALSRCLNELSTANISARMGKATMKVVDITTKTRSRTCLREQKSRNKKYKERLEKASTEAHDWLTNFGDGTGNLGSFSNNLKPNFNRGQLLGRVVVSSVHGSQNRVVPMVVTRSELKRLHTILV